MYNIYSTTKGKRICIHNGFVADGRIKLIDPELELSANSPGSLTFTIPPNHVAYNDYDLVELSVVRAGVEGTGVDVNEEGRTGKTYILRGTVSTEDDLYSLTEQPIIGDVYAVSYEYPPIDQLTGEDGNWSLSIDPDTQQPRYDWASIYTEYMVGTTHGTKPTTWANADPEFDSTAIYRHIITNDDDKYMVYDDDVFEIMDSEEAPADWEANYYKSYYYRDEVTGFYERPYKADHAPEWIPNYYYIHQWTHLDTNVALYVERTTKLNLVERMISEITVYRLETHKDTGNRYEKEIWFGRVLSEEVDWNGSRKIYCEGGFGYLNDTIQPQRVWGKTTTLRQFITGVLNYHNSKVADSHKFKRGTIENVVDESNLGEDVVIGEWKTDYGSTMETLAALVDKYGGYFRVDPPSTSYKVVTEKPYDWDDAGWRRYWWYDSSRGLYITNIGTWPNDKEGHPKFKSGSFYAKITDVCHRLSYIRKPNEDDAAKADLIKNGHYVELGKNLLDFTKKWDLSQLVTSIIPAGATKNETQSGAGLEHTDGKKEEPKKVIAQAAAYEYHAATYPGDSTWAASYFEYYVKSDTTSSGYKKVSKSKKGRVPSWSAGTYYTRTQNANRVTVMSANSDYQIIRYDVIAGHKYYISTVIDKDHYAWAWYSQASGGGTIISNPGKNTSITKTYKDYGVTAPEGAASIRICGYGKDVAISLKDEVQDKSDEFDKRWRITECDTDEETVTEKGETKKKLWHLQGSEYISHPDLVEKYGNIERQVTFDSVSKTSDSETDASVEARLYAEAKKYLKSTQFDKMSLDVEAADLRMLGVQYEGLMLYDSVYVKSVPHGLDKIFPVTEMTIPISHPEEMRVTLGYESDSTITGVTVSTTSGLKADVKAIPSQSSTLKQAKAGATDVIFGETGGYVYFENGSGESGDIATDRIRAMCVVNKKTDPDKMWKFSLGGLGYREKHNGQWQDVRTAMTADGKVVADAILTGNLNAERINGGTLTLGGAYESGSIARIASHMEIRDSQNNLVANAGVDGYNSYGTWSNNKAPYTKIDDGYLTAGEVTRNPSTGDITSTSQYGYIYPNYNPGNNTHNVALVASYGGSSEGEANNGRLYIAAKEIIVTKNYLDSGDLKTGSSSSLEVITSARASVDGRTVTINFTTQKMSFVNGIFVGYTTGSGAAVSFQIP